MSNHSDVMRKLWADPEYRAKQMASRRKKGVRRQHMTDPLPARILEKRGGLVSDDETERLCRDFQSIAERLTKARETAQARADDLQALADRQRQEIERLRKELAVMLAPPILPLDENGDLYHPVHPEYGPCDRLGKAGECTECQRYIREAIKQLRACDLEIEQLRKDNARAQEWIDERRAICDLLSAQPETNAGQTLVEALQSVLAALAALAAQEPCP